MENKISYLEDVSLLIKQRAKKTEISLRLQDLKKFLYQNVVEVDSFGIGRYGQVRHMDD